MSDFDVVVIGGGPGGYVAAIRAAQLGLKVACVEKDKTLGGTCLNVGCIPSKALLDSSEHYHQTKHKLSKHGIVVGDVKIDLTTMMKRKDGVVGFLTGGIEALFKKNKIEWIKGAGSIKSAGVVEVGGRSISAKNIVIATGSVPIEIPVAKYDGKRIVDSAGALSLPEIPKHLVVVGGGVIGLELGSVWARLGAKVTVLEGSDRICPFLDQAVGREFHKVLTAQGLEIRVGSKLTSAKSSGKSVEVQYEAAGKTETLDADYVLVSVGRRPYVDGLNLDAVGVKHERGRVQIDDHFRTTVPGIYAVGDCVRGPMLAHKAEEEGVACAEIIAGHHGHVNYDAIPSVIYTWPEVAWVGKNEEDLKAAGIAYKAGQFPFRINGRAKAMDELDGFVKILADAKTDRVLGAHIIGPRASEMISELVSVMEFGGAAEDIARTCHAHPTLPEVVKEAALAVNKRVLHM